MIEENLLLSVYLEINLLLALVWLLNRLLNKTAAYLGWNFSQSSQLKAARSIFLLVLIIPFLFRAVPTNVGESLAKPVAMAQLAFVDLNLSNVLASPFVESNTVDVDVLAVERSELSRELFDVMPWLQLAGVLGFALLSVRLLFHVSSLFKLIKRSYCWKHAGSVYVYISNEISVPFSTQLFGKGQIVIPEQLFTSAEYLPIIIAHEGQHLKNKDGMWEILLEMCRLFFYWNPAIYLWKTDFDQLQEYACDEVVLGNKKVTTKTYSKCLLHVAEQYNSGQVTPVACNSMSGKSVLNFMSKSILGRRLQMLLEKNKHYQSSFKSQTYRFSSYVITALLGFFVVAYSNAASTEVTDNNATAAISSDSSLECSEQNQCVQLEVSLLVVTFDEQLESNISETSFTENFPLKFTANPSVLDYVSALSVFGDIDYMMNPFFEYGTVEILSQESFGSAGGGGFGLSSDIQLDYNLAGIADVQADGAIALDLTLEVNKYYNSQEILASDDLATMLDSLKFNLGTKLLMQPGETLMLSTAFGDNTLFRSITEMQNDLVLLVRATTSTGE